eukprot:1986307-Amphidinium_carterae.1
MSHLLLDILAVGEQVWVVVLDCALVALEVDNVDLMVPEPRVPLDLPTFTLNTKYPKSDANIKRD